MPIESEVTIANRHDFDATVSKTYTVSQSQTIFLSPTSGLRLKCVGGHASTAATSGNILIYFRDSGHVIADLSPNNTGQTYFIIPPALHIGREDDPIMVTSTTGANNLQIALNVENAEYSIPLGTSTSTTTSSTTSTSTTAT